MEGGLSDLSGDEAVSEGSQGAQMGPNVIGFPSVATSITCLVFFFGFLELHTSTQTIRYKRSLSVNGCAQCFTSQLDMLSMMPL